MNTKAKARGHNALCSGTSAFALEDDDIDNLSFNSLNEDELNGFCSPSKKKKKAATAASPSKSPSQAKSKLFPKMLKTPIRKGTKKASGAGAEETSPGFPKLSPFSRKKKSIDDRFAPNRTVSEDNFSFPTQNDWDLSDTEDSRRTGDGFLEPVSTAKSALRRPSKALTITHNDVDWFSELESEVETKSESPGGNSDKKKDKKKKKKSSSKETKGKTRSGKTKEKDVSSPRKPKNKKEEENDPLSLTASPGKKASSSLFNGKLKKGKTSKKSKSPKRHGPSDEDDDGSDSGNESDYIIAKELLTPRRSAMMKKLEGRGESFRSQRRPSMAPRLNDESESGISGREGEDDNRSVASSTSSRGSRRTGHETRRPSACGSTTSGHAAAVTSQRPGAHQAATAGRGNHRDRSRSRSRSRRSASRGSRAMAMQKSMLGAANSALGGRNVDEDDEKADEDIEALFKSAQSEERHSMLAKSRQGPVRSIKLDEKCQPEVKVESIPVEEIQQKAAMKVHRRASCAGYLPTGLNSESNKSRHGGAGSSALDELFKKDPNQKKVDRRPSCAASLNGGVAAGEGGKRGAAGYNPSSSMDNYLSSSASYSGEPTHKHHHPKSHHRRNHAANSELSSALDSILFDSRKHRKDLNKKVSSSPRSQRAQLNAALDAATKTGLRRAKTDSGGIILPLADEEKKKTNFVARLAARRASAATVKV